MPGYTVTIDDGGLADRLALLGKGGLRKAERRGVTAVAQFGRTNARRLAPVATGAGRRGISYKTFSRGGAAAAIIYNKVYYMRFQSTGVPFDRYTHTTDANRGVLPQKRFMQDTVDVLEGGAAGQIIGQAVGDALRAAGL
jgi:hypothetical protein